MIRLCASLIALSFALGTGLAGYANAQDKAERSQAERNKELTRSIDDLIAAAIEEGLLQSSDGEPVSKPSAAKPTGKSEQPQSASRVAEVYSCKDVSKIDFSNYQDLRLYGDIQYFREQARQAEEDRIVPTTKAFVGALIALGLYDEALAELDRLPAQDAEVFVEITGLLRREDRAAEPLIKGLEGCYNRPLWKAIAELAAMQETGVHHFDDVLHEFRGLPFQMRTEVITLIVPALVDFGHADVANQALVSFSKEDIDTTESLTFAKTVIDFGQGDADAEYKLRSYLNNRHFRSDALYVLSQQQSKDKHAIEHVPVKDLISVVEQSEKTADVSIALNGALSQLLSKSDYRAIAKLAKSQPVYTDPDRRSKVVTMLGDALVTVIEDGSARQQLDAFDVLISDPELLAYYPGQAKLYQMAIKVADASGYRSLVQRLGKAAGLKSALQQTQLAFALKNASEVYRLAEAHPKNSEINLISAQQAILDKKPNALSRYAARAGRSDNAVLTLLEQDVASGAWMVSGDVWKAVGLIKSEDGKPRAERLIAIRAAHMEAKRSKGTVGLKRTRAVLDKSNTWLSSRMQEGG